MIGVCLAAGDATRMPNKLMLHTPAKLPLVMDSIKYLYRFTKEIVVVVKPDGAVHRYLHGSARRLRFVFQERATGVVKAISAVEAECILVAFGDCYGYQNLAFCKENHATVMYGLIPGLDGWDGNGWVDRTSLPPRPFSGAFHSTRWEPADTLMNTFNHCEIMPQITNGVKDCGTPEGYAKLWSSSLRNMV